VTTRHPNESPALKELRERIDKLDRRIVELLNERTELTIEAGREKAKLGRRAIRDARREREVLLRVSIANGGPLPQADLLALYRRLIAASRELEGRDRQRRAADAEDPSSEPPSA